MSKLIKKAHILNRVLHGDQKRRYTNTPYFWHPIRVAKLLVRTGLDCPIGIASALLHDVVEDTHCTLEDLEALMGSQVAFNVSKLTDPKMPKVNRKDRKNFQRFRLAKSPPIVQSIKMCDLYDNCKSIVKHDEAFAKVFMKEYEELYNALDLAHPRIRALCDKQLNEYFTIQA